MVYDFVIITIVLLWPCMMPMEKMYLRKYIWAVFNILFIFLC